MKRIFAPRTHQHTQDSEPQHTLKMGRVHRAETGHWQHSHSRHHESSSKRSDGDDVYEHADHAARMDSMTGLGNSKCVTRNDHPRCMPHCDFTDPVRSHAEQEQQQGLNDVPDPSTSQTETISDNVNQDNTVPADANTQSDIDDVFIQAEEVLLEPITALTPLALLAGHKHLIVTNRKDPGNYMNVDLLAVHRTRQWDSYWVGSDVAETLCQSTCISIQYT